MMYSASWLRIDTDRLFLRISPGIMSNRLTYSLETVLLVCQRAAHQGVTRHGFGPLALIRRRFHETMLSA